MYPGLQLQKLTTREPDLDQLAVSIAALEAVLELEKPGEMTADDLLGVEVVAEIRHLRGRAVAQRLGPRPCNPGGLPAHCGRRIDGSGDGWFRGEPREADASSL